MKATFIEKYYSLEGNPILIYEYLGYYYEVTDYGWKGGEPISWQHKNCQSRIDGIIINEEKAKNYKTEPAQVGIDFFFSEEYENLI